MWVLCSNTSNVVTSLDDIVWTLNIRGNDIEFFLLILSYLIITMNEVHLFINENKLSHEIKSSLKKNGALFIHPYNKIYKEVITEISASNKLDEFRAEQGGFICPSFEPISSFGEHVAIVYTTLQPLKQM
ncbi:hypothetical protein RSJ19_12390 [Clostridium botulinum]|nr:hypothetical protein RSJ19_12390 [Clostridium botulinum]